MPRVKRWLSYIQTNHGMCFWLIFGELASNLKTRYLLLSKTSLGKFDDVCPYDVAHMHEHRVGQIHSHAHFPYHHLKTGAELHQSRSLTSHHPAQQSTTNITVSYSIHAEVCQWFSFHGSFSFMFLYMGLPFQTRLLILTLPPSLSLVRLRPLSSQFRVRSQIQLVQIKKSCLPEDSQARRPAANLRPRLLPQSSFPA